MCPDILKFIVHKDLKDTNSQGYLLGLEEWSEDFAIKIAHSQGIELTEAHWEIIHFLRTYYDEFGLTPNARLLAKAVSKQFGPDKGSQKFLYELFPKGPSFQGCKIGGLPIPRDCIDILS